ncbi:hypothetical protein KR52_08780 [Synechococcus sp. KORDI-52]|nr:hypothetical protein KR52_08780 [Synechococcus sp. KORDI-52]
MKDESFCIEFATSLAVMLLELNAELLELAEQDGDVFPVNTAVEFERSC